MRINIESIGIDPVRLKPLLLNIVNIFSLFIIAIALSAAPRSFAAGQPSDVPAWLSGHVGEGEGQIAEVVLQRARTLYFKKVQEGAVTTVLLCHGRHPPQRFWRGAPVLRYLRSRAIVSRDFGGTRRRS